MVDNSSEVHGMQNVLVALLQVLLVVNSAALVVDDFLVRLNMSNARFSSFCVTASSFGFGSSSAMTTRSCGRASWWLSCRRCPRSPRNPHPVPLAVVPLFSELPLSAAWLRRAAASSLYQRERSRSRRLSGRYCPPLRSAPCSNSSEPPAG